MEYDLEKIDYLLDAVKSKNAKLIAQIREKHGAHSYSPENSLLIAQRYIDYLLDQGISRQNILLDPLVRPLEEDLNNGKIFLNTLELFKLDFPQVKTLANVSQLSEGLPKKPAAHLLFCRAGSRQGLGLHRDQRPGRELE